MLHQVLDLLIILLRQTIARRIGNVHNGGTRLDDGLNHLSQVLIVGTACVLTVELHVVDIALGILRGSHSPLDNLLASRVELVHNVLIAGADTSVNAFVLGILQGVERHVDVALYGSRQRADGGPRHCLRDFNHGVKVTRTRNGKSCFNHVDAQLLKCLGHLNFLNGVQLTSGHLFTVAQRRVENKQPFHFTTLQFFYFIVY